MIKSIDYTLLTLKIFMVITAIYTVLIISPSIIGNVIEKDVTFIYNDENGVFDDCNNFYTHEFMDTKTISTFNKYMKKMDTSIQPTVLKVKIYVPDQNIPVPSSWKQPSIREVIEPTNNYNTSCKSYGDSNGI